MRYEFIVEFKSLDNTVNKINPTVVKRYTVPGDGVDINDAWFEVVQMACKDCKARYYMSSIYYSLF